MCTLPSAPDNGGVTCSGNSVGETCDFTCDDGFELVGSMTSTCTAAPDGNSAMFVPIPPTCRRKYYLKLSAVVWLHFFSAAVSVILISHNLLYKLN